MQTHGVDHFGALVGVGDKVVCMVPYYKELTTCKVLKVTPKGFTVEYRNHNGYLKTTSRCVVIRHPDQED